jgi:hypothetical protein
VAVAVSNTNTSDEDANDTTNADGAAMDTDDNDDNDGDGENAPIVGPVLIKKEEVVVKDEAIKTENATTTTNYNGPVTAPEGPEEDAFEDIEVVGGAWGAAPGSVLAKLIEEQEKQQQQSQNQNQNNEQIMKLWCQR